MTHILVIEDEDRISSFLAKGLKAQGYAVSVAANARDGFGYIQAGQVDLLVLDLGLPDEDGFSLLKRVRAAQFDMPVIILTARSSVTDTVAGLDLGADDYMAKPVRFDELLARIRLRLRRLEAAAAQPASSDGQVKGDQALVLDFKTRRARLNGEQIDLSAREFALLETLMRHPDQVLSREQLLTKVWGYDYDPNTNIVDVYIGYLRKKIGPERIETLRGMGYRLKPQ
jgi:DNA-binding response OmpR family regulator